MDKKVLIEKYIDAYNSCNVEGMVELLDGDIYFQNIVQNEVNLSLLGRTAFREQATHAAAIFEDRKQTILALNERDGGDQIEAGISFEGKVAVDLPNGLKAGERVTLAGKTIFGFSNNKIVLIRDIT